MNTHEQHEVIQIAIDQVAVRDRNTMQPVLRHKSKDLMQNRRELEIDHEGRIYRLRVTQLNKLILTA
ncbi:hemin uptake protein HemP [Undibacterium sp. SXout20W]|uniref:hemin uptake protein HemP n=1 Tax=Undibacterium sp. SXout20W TaxID=3413051 RepID=UPI003BEF5CA4